MTKVKVTVEVIGLSLTNRVSTITQKKLQCIKTNFTKSETIKKVSHAQCLSSLNQGLGHNRRSCFCC